MSIPNIGGILSSTRQIGGDAMENAIAKAFLAKHVDHYDRVDFAVKLGPGILLGPGYEPWVQKAATANSQARADMVLWRGDIPTIVEVKGNIRPSALGQLITYWTLMRADNPKLLQVYKIVIGNTIQAGLQEIFQQYAVSVELFPYVAPATDAAASTSV